VHGSTTGNNFNINTKKQTWHCYRHETGGNALYLIAICEGLISCADVRRGAMAGEEAGGSSTGGRLFIDAVKIANRRFGAGIGLRQNSKRDESPRDKPPLDESIHGERPPRQANTDTLPWSDYTNALAFVHDHGENLRYCDDWKKRLVWMGMHWKIDNTGAAMRMAKQTARRLARQVEHIDDIEAKVLLKHVKKSLSNASLKAMIDCAQSEEGISIEPNALDKDPWRLNCANGTLDLRTGKLQPHNRADLITRCISTPYDPNAKCPTWDAFLSCIMGDNQALIGFLQRAIGYSLTGVIREHVLIILWDSGRNGKSTFLNTLRALLEAYAMKAPSELLMVSNNDRHPTERADLLGKRFICAIETEEGRRLAEVFVKEATGGDPIRARRMREDFWEFQPTHKVFFGGKSQASC
jgi:putative DNA primase/helicase